MDEVFLVEELLERCDNRDNQNRSVTTGCDHPQSHAGQGCDNRDNSNQGWKNFDVGTSRRLPQARKPTFEGESDRFSLLSLDEENIEINREGVVTPVTVVTEEEGAKSLYPELVNRRIRSLVSAKVGVVKEVIAGGHIPVMVIVQFDGEEFTIPTSPEKLTFEDGSPFPKLESASTVSEKGTELPQPNWVSYPHLTSSDNRAYQKRAKAIALQMLSACNVNQLKVLWAHLFVRGVHEFSDQLSE